MLFCQPQSESKKKGKPGLDATGVSCNKANYFRRKAVIGKILAPSTAIVLIFYPKESRFSSLSSNKMTEKIYNPKTYDYFLASKFLKNLITHGLGVSCNNELTTSFKCMLSLCMQLMHSDRVL